LPLKQTLLKMKYYSGSRLIIIIFASLSIYSCRGIQQISEPGERISIENTAYNLTVTISESSLIMALEDKKSNFRVANGPYIYSYGVLDIDSKLLINQLEKSEIYLRDSKLFITGQLRGVDLEHTFYLPAKEDFMEEKIRFTNNTSRVVALPEFEAGFTRIVSNKTAGADSVLLSDRWIAVPLKERSDDPYEFVHDYSLNDLINKPGSEPHPNHRQWINPAPSRHRWSEAWAWTHGEYTLGIFSFCQENMVFSVLSTIDSGDHTYLRFGGACEIMGEPSALLHIEPGQTVDLGINRYQTMESDFMSAMYSYRKILDETGCRFPPNYNPPVHWNQIFDMDGDWDNRTERYTREKIIGEAKKAARFNCDALYLDPGWDTEFASFIWEEERLGNQKEFIQEIKADFGLDLALHCPLGTWMSTWYPMGPSAVSTFPPESYRVDTPEKQKRKKVPFERNGKRNLSLLPAATSSASSVRENYALPMYKIHHLNNGWYGESNSWIAKEMPAWAAVDLGDIYTISKICLGNDHTISTPRNAVSELNLQVTTKVGATRSTEWKTVARYSGEPLSGEMVLNFAATDARQVRVNLLNSSSGSARLDEIEIYEDKSSSEKDLHAYETYAEYEELIYPSSPPLVCMGSQQYMNVAEQRLLDHCRDGVVFLMFDGNWWNGGCADTNHNHPIPYHFEDHIRANIEMANRIHAKYPDVLIEMHDMIVGGSFGRVTPVYYKYGIAGSYDENWGFELMWDPLASIMEDKAILKDPTFKPGKALPLYYYNLGCNVPIYLHIDLSSDNIHCLSFWWYASTCRHLGIGGTHRDSDVVEAQVKAMEKYQQWAHFFKRGEFYGINEEIHLHVLPDQKAFVVNIFNLTDQARAIKGSIKISDLGLEAKDNYTGIAEWGQCNDGVFKVAIELQPWSTTLAKFHIKSPDK